MDTLILASKSPRRRHILEAVGIPFMACDVVVDERMISCRSIRAAVMGVSRKKAKAAGEFYSRGLALGVDTVVLFHGKVLGKPEGEEEAYRYMKMLSGNTHQVLSGITLWDIGSDTLRSDCSLTDVRFVRLRETEIRRYLRAGEWHDKAGGYGIQGRAAFYVASIRGSYHNVMGLPLEKLYRLLDRFAYFRNVGKYEPLGRGKRGRDTG
jgi:septum formation protein